MPNNAKKKQNSVSMGKYATLGQIASLLKVDARTVNRWSDPTDRIHIKGFGKVEHGKYDIVKCVHARVDDYERMLNEAQSSVKDAKEQNLLLDAQQKELKLAELRKELIRADDFTQFFYDLLVFIKVKAKTSEKIATPKISIAQDDKAISKELINRDEQNFNEYLNFIKNKLGSMAEFADKDFTASGTAKTTRRRKAK